MDMKFFRGKRILITGHTGFKGSWLCHILINAGAEVFGYALSPPTQPSLFQLSGLSDRMNSFIGDIRDFKKLSQVFAEVKPHFVIHMAAQPIVRESYNTPRETFETNVMGTVNVLECIRNTGGILSALNVTTDKVYKNNEWCYGYRETDILGGFDPYSNSKSCSELVTESYRNSFFDSSVAMSTARAGNVIGGGDFAPDRIIPDCIRAAMDGEKIAIRNPNSTRPYQHVLEPLFAYLQIIRGQCNDRSIAGCYNVGPDDYSCVTTGELADIFCSKWGENITWGSSVSRGPHEAGFLKLDCSKIKDSLGWKPRWGIETAVQKTVDWSKAYRDRGQITAIMDRQIEEYLN